MLAHSVVLAATLLQPPGADPVELDPTPEPARVERFRALLLGSEGIAFPILRGALELRMPGVAIDRHRAGAHPGQEPYAFVHVRRIRDDRSNFRLTAITSDGRAYFRDIDAGPDQEDRVLASTIANLIFSIEAGAVQPDQEGVAIPEAESRPNPEPKPAPESSSEPEPAPGRVAKPPSWELGPSAGLGILLGLGPPRFADVFAGWGGGVGFDARAPRGGLFAFDVRITGREVKSHRLTRIRFALGGGYAWRLSALEVGVAAAVTVEPWVVSRAGVPVDVERPVGSGAGYPPLLGALVRLSPGYRIELAPSTGSGRTGGGIDSVRVGPRLEMAGSFAIDDGANVPGVAHGDDGRELFRLGGLELYAGLEVALWFRVAGR